jgi:phosphoribosylamine--glycine ligase
MKVLIIGNGGREHAIGIKIKKDNPHVNLFFAIGNGGTASIGKNIDIRSIDEIVHFAMVENIDITIVGSETLLVEGIVDKFNDHHLKIFGPHKAAAVLEGDKAFAKSFMKEFGIRTANYNAFTDVEEALRFLNNQKFPLVIKATGLAAGKGVFIIKDFQEATKCVIELLSDHTLGDAGNEIIIEEFLQGFEVSILSVCNNNKIYPLISAKDHKKIYDNDQGPNTGGMGAVAPNPLYNDIIQHDFEVNILAPTLRGLKERRLLFSGVIFFGLMVVNNICYLLEYNMRMGDPETQTILPLLKSNFLDTIKHAISGDEIYLDWHNNTSCCVVLASKGYPYSYETNKEIMGLNNADLNYVIAGANKVGNDYFSSGGRVVNIIETGDTLIEARTKAYNAVNKVNFEGVYFRNDIGVI